MKSVTYARVSSKEQEVEGYSLPSQEKLFRDYSERKGFIVAKKFSISESASGRHQRKTFDEMLQYIIKNKINIIICEKVDRLTRNLKDALAINDWLEENPERQVHFVKTNLIIHKNSKSDEKFRWDIEVVLARKYINNLSEEVKKGQKEKLAQGWSPQGNPPIGYKIIGEKGRKTHILDEEKASLIRKMFELYSTGDYSIKAITKIMKDEGLRNKKNNPISKSQMHRLLSNSFYYGKILWRGELYAGKQEHLIDKELFDSVQEKLSFKFGGKPRYRKHLSIFKAKISCAGCSGRMSWQLQKGRWYGSCNHYRNCPQKTWVRQDQVEEQLLPFFIKEAPKNEKVLGWLKDMMKKSSANEIDFNSNKKEELNRIINTADKRIEGAYKDKLDERMPYVLCEKIIKEATQEKENAINTLGKLNQSRAIYYEAGCAIHELALRAKEIYLSPKVSLEERRLLLTYIFSNLTLDEGKLSINYTESIEFLTKWLIGTKKIFEPLKTGSFKHKTEADASVCTIMRGRWDLNPRSPP